MTPTAKGIRRKRQFRVVFEKGYDGYIIAECLDIPGCMSQGKTLEEARENIKNAMQECLEVILEDALAKQRAPGKGRKGLGSDVFTFELVGA